MAKKPKYWWIKEVCNQQLGFYYYTYGQMTMEDAKLMGNTSYGSNIMLKFGSEQEYFDKIAKLKKQGKRVS